MKLNRIKTDAYNGALKERFLLDEVHSIVSSGSERPNIAVSTIKGHQTPRILSEPFDPDDAYVVGLIFRDFPSCEVWEQGRFVAKEDDHAGDTRIYDLRNSPQFLMDHPFEAMLFHLPMSAINSIADEARVPRIGGLSYSRGVGFRDAILAYLGKSIWPALKHPEQANRLFVDHVTLALTAHVAETYGGLRPVRTLPRGGLAPWQERRACEMLAAKLDGDQSMRDIAAACGLSVSHFSRAFRQSTGLPPHRWLLRHRIELAKSMMEDRRHSLADIAISVGFADQSHLTRVFTRHVGVSPGAWRRARELGFATED